MYYISKVRIQRFRSIMDMEFNISDYSMPVAICGQNNVGKVREFVEWLKRVSTTKRNIIISNIINKISNKEIDVFAIDLPF